VVEEGDNKMKIYLAILCDRHTDDEFAAFYDKLMALTQCSKWQKKYPEYEFEDEEISGWEYYSNASEDGPSTRIEKIELI
jgi:hypothetical protein